MLVVFILSSIGSCRSWGPNWKPNLMAMLLLLWLLYARWSGQRAGPKSSRALLSLWLQVLSAFCCSSFNPRHFAPLYHTLIALAAAIMCHSGKWGKGKCRIHHNMKPSSAYWKIQREHLHELAPYNHVVDGGISQITAPFTLSNQSKLRPQL